MKRFAINTGIALALGLGLTLALSLLALNGQAAPITRQPLNAGNPSIHPAGNTHTALPNTTFSPAVSQFRAADVGLAALPTRSPAPANVQESTSDGLVLWNKLGSDYEVTHSEVGENGTVVGTAYAYEAAKYGNGYVRKATGENYVEFPASVIHNLSYKGTIELWITPKVPNPVPYQYGFFALVGQPVSGPTVPINRGNVYLYWGDGVTGRGLYGGVRFDGSLAQTPSEPTQFVATVGEPFHAAIVWDIDGIDGTNDKVRVYRNGVVVGSTTDSWNPDGTLLEDRFRLGQGPDGQGYDKFISDNIQIWNYAKTDFSDRFTESPFGFLTLTPPAQTNQGGRGQVVVHEEALINGTGATDSFSLTLGSHAWDTAFSTDTLGPLAYGDSLTFTVYVSIPLDATWHSTDTVVVTATSVASPTMYSDTATLTTQAYVPPQISVSPDALASVQDVTQIVTKTLTISNGNGVTLTFSVYEMHLDGRRILYDRTHGEPGSSSYSSLVNDAVNAGAEVTENWYSPVDAAALEGYDVLWVNCCGGTAWGLGELNAVSTWLDAEGAVFVQGESSLATDGPASIFGVNYESGTCTSGTTANITDHPISQGVGKVNVEQTCWRLAPSSSAEIVVLDPQGQPHVVAQEQNGGKMVVVAGEDFIEGHIGNDDNRLLGNNILAWLAGPRYGDVPWLSEAPQTSVVPSRSSLPVTLEFDATALSLGSYHAVLAIEHDDPSQPSPIEVPVTLAVTRRTLWLPLVLKNGG